MSLVAERPVMRSIVSAPAKSPEYRFEVVRKSDGTVLGSPQPSKQEAWDAFWCGDWWKVNRVVTPDTGVAVRLNWSERESCFEVRRITA